MKEKDLNFQIAIDCEDFDKIDLPLEERFPIEKLNNFKDKINEKYASMKY